MGDPTRLSLEQRLVQDEARLTRDEARLEREESEVRESRIVAWLGVGLALASAIAVAALVVGLIALRGDVGSIRRAAPAESVSTAALRDGSVTAAKLAPEAVRREAVTAGAIASAQLAPGAVTGAQVAPNSLTGADVRERSLSLVPQARDAQRLGGIRAGAFLSQPFEVSVTSLTDVRSIKGPVSARCPAGSRVLSGGASIDGVVTGASLVSNAPEGAQGWTATARVVRRPAPAWRLVVTAICTVGGG